MRVRILSDLHNEFETFAPEPTDADVVILAGDISVGEKGLLWIASAFPGERVVYVVGNHEYYGRAIPHLTDKLKAASNTRVSFLERQFVDIGDVRFYGCTLWSDFCVEGDQSRSMDRAREVMNDYRRIRVSPRYRRLTPDDTAIFHKASVDWLQKECVAFSGRKVIVTHHAPSAQSLDPARKGDYLNGAFALNLEALVQSSGALLWVHGHTHYCIDYKLGRTRVVSNQLGYPGERVTGFDPQLCHRHLRLCNFVLS